MNNMFRKEKIDNNIIGVIKYKKEERAAKILMKNRVTRIVNLKREIQRGFLSPKLFDIFMNKIIRDVKRIHDRKYKV